MKVLYIQTPTSYLGSGERVYPLGLARLSGIECDKIDKSAIDLNIEPDPWPALKTRLEEYRPDISVISFRNIDPLAGHQSSYLASLRTCAAMVRTLVPQCRIIAGGPAFSIFGTDIMKEIMEIDIGITGAGESVLPFLLDDVIEDVTKLPGVVRREKDRIIINSQSPCTDMNKLPRLNRDLFKPDDYVKANKYVAAIGIEGKRGCDLNCSYCVYPGISGSRFHIRDAKFIVNEMEILNKENGIELFHFTDSVLNRPVEYFNALCSEIMKRKLSVQWTGFFREDTFTKESLGFAIDAGLAAVYFSADALTDAGLKLLNKKLTKKNIFESARISAESGILTMCHFLVNLPFEEESHFVEAKETLLQLLDIHYKAANLGAVIFGNIRLYPGASITNTLLKKGLIDPEINLLYPVYYNPVKTSYILHKLESICYQAGVFSRLAI